MFDVHYHLIFGVDDGPATIDKSLELAKASIAEGVTHIVATPHANEDYPFRRDLNLERLAEIRSHLDNQVILGLGCDFHLSYDNMRLLEHDPRAYTINGSQYLLMELSDYGFPFSMDEIFLRLESLGTIPIITHPERNSMLLSDPSLIERWISYGCIIQVTAGSLDGRFGRLSEAMGYNLIRKNQVHLVSSDAHSLRGRPPAMKRAFSLIEKTFGIEAANILCIENPKAVYYGLPISFKRVLEKRADRTRGILNLMPRQ